MNKILKKYTTIPEHLYVKRSADKQLEEIINDMQRPGYVLVARQMGKTNLLFHAKRTLESKDRLFVYVDLSNSFDHEKDCYRNIIDCILEPNEELFESIKNKIHSIRDMELQPHKEYSRSLRKILSYFQGDLVIVLDEIDALRGAEYSDNIFAQIRSNYFSRTNFPVFERLTYILSGVIEPTELIKDRNKSPFNIGDKIYLDDFTFKEHEAFIQKSELEVDNEISREIYKWTNGNPRLTFDICAEVESQLIDDVLIDRQKISEIINDKYLVSYDIAPVDHIRELVKSNIKIREAVLDIHRGGKKDINDEIKNKLYLCGIINSDFQNNTIIKNPIIAKSISENWIQSIEKENQSNYSIGLSLVDTKDYTQALTVLSDYLQYNDPTEAQIENCNYSIGFCLFKLDRFNEAITYFLKDYYTKSFKENSLYLLGVCYLKENDVDTGKEKLKAFIELETFNFFYRQAVFSYNSLILKEDPTETIKLYDRLITSLENPNDVIDTIDLNSLYTITHTYKAMAYYDMDLVDMSIGSINKALEYSERIEEAYLLYLQNMVDKSSDKNETQKKITALIIENELELDETFKSPCSFTYSHLLVYLDFVYDIGDSKQYNKLCKYTLENLISEKSHAQLILDIDEFTDSKNNHLENFIDNSTISNISPLESLSIYRNIARNNFDNLDKFYLYFYVFKDLLVDVNELLSIDIYIFGFAIKKLHDDHQDLAALDLCKFLESKLNQVTDESIKSESIFVYFWTSAIYRTSEIFDSALEYAVQTLKLIDELKHERTSLIDEEGLKSIKQQMLEIKQYATQQLNSKTNSHSKQKKYGRNDRITVHYPNQGLVGSTFEGKYKKFSDDINNKKCIVIE